MTTVVFLGLKGPNSAVPARQIRSCSPGEKRFELGRGVAERLAGLVLGSIVWSAGVALFVFY